MPLKFNKELSSRLFKFVSKVDIKFNAFDGRAQSAREIHRQVRAKRFIQANPRLAIEFDLHNRADAPKIDFHFIDGSLKKFDCQENAKDILFQVHLKAMELDSEYEMLGKNADDQ